MCEIIIREKKNHFEKFLFFFLFCFFFYSFRFLLIQFISDIDECAQKGGLNGNHCHLNTICVNTNGSYECDCSSGYRRVDKFNCAEINECALGQHSCHANAKCTNTMGSYECRCNDGYAGDGFECKRKFSNPFFLYFFVLA